MKPYNLCWSSPIRFFSTLVSSCLSSLASAAILSRLFATSALNVPMFIGARFCSQWFLFISMNCHADAQLLFHSRIVGIGLSFCQNASPLLLIELSYPTQVLSPSMSFLVILKYFTSPFLKQARAHYVHVQLMLVFWKHHLCLDMPRSVWTCGR